MARADREHWDRRYAEPRWKLRRGPHTLLVNYAPPAQPGSRALELACGLGHNALWLAEQGYTVDALDISFTALRHARTMMRQRQLSGANFILADLDEFHLPVYAYDLVLVFRFLDRALFPALRDRVRPGGMVIYETLNVGHLQRNPDARDLHMLQRGELPGFFPDWEIVHSDDGRFTSAFVGHKPG